MTRLVDNFLGERTYEFYFNLCLVQVKQQLCEEAFRSLLRSYELAKDDEHAMHTDITRFKIQELHTLCSFSHEFS